MPARIGEAMRVFGKSLGEYVSFQKVILILIVIVGAGRLALSLGGVSNSIGKWLSITAVMALGTIYYPIRAAISGFGSYRHLLPMLVIQDVLAQSIIILGIAIAIFTGRDNIFSEPEFARSENGKTWSHAAAHAVFGMILAPLMFWLIAAGIMFITKKLVGKESGKRAAANT
jgi:hypothetical protein